MTTHQQTPAVHDEHAHPSEAVYIKVALILGVLTGIEVALSYLKIGGSQLLTNGGLLILAAIKFATVALYFMHLKFDNPILRRLFVAGLTTAVIVYLLYLLTLHTFIG